MTQQIAVSSLSGNVLIASVSGNRKKVFGLRIMALALSTHSSLSWGVGARLGLQAHLVGTWSTISWNAYKFVISGMQLMVCNIPAPMEPMCNSCAMLFPCSVVSQGMHLLLTVLTHSTFSGNPGGQTTCKGHAITWQSLSSASLIGSVVLFLSFYMYYHHC